MAYLAHNFIMKGRLAESMARARATPRLDTGPLLG